MFLSNRKHLFILYKAKTQQYIETIQTYYRKHSETQNYLFIYLSMIVCVFFYPSHILWCRLPFILFLLTLITPWRVERRSQYNKHSSNKIR